MKLDAMFLRWSVPLRPKVMSFVENLGGLSWPWHLAEREPLRDQSNLSGRQSNKLLQLQILLIALSVVTLFAGLAHGQEQAAVANTPANYAGPEACKTCHEDIYNNFDKSPHWKTMLDKRGGPSKQGCEACHGPGQNHIEGGGDKSKIFSFKSASAKQVNERCLDCHASGQDHMNFSRSAHSEHNVSCIDCHSPHHAKEGRFLLVKSQPQLCYTCHLNIKPLFNMPFHHRVNERLVKCVDCHNPHGGFLGKQLRSAAARDAVCFTCHADKQGPFVFEHKAVKTDGCESCHVPHGSPNPHMLKQSNLNLLCLQCHTGSSFSSAPGTPQFHNQAAQFQACTICHAAIHGSNFDRHLMK